MNYLSNNNIILVEADKDIQKKRLMERGYTNAQIQNRMNSQHTSVFKEQMIRESIGKDYHGHLWKIDNSDDGNKENISGLVRDINNYLGL